MKTSAKCQLFAALLLMAASGCKKTECEPTVTGNTTTAAVPEVVAKDTAETPNAGTNDPKRNYVKKRPNEKLTQYQIDSIKTERGALVTPAGNVGPSLTPGSGRAVPENDKAGPGTTANMGSSTGK